MFKRRKKRFINLLIKPTNGCNLRCKYCFSNDYKVNSLDVELFEKMLKLLSKEADVLQIIWHGGEPTLWGIDNFKKAFDIVKKYSSKMKITQALQSNCIHISDEMIDLLLENKVSIGSSFDGITNDDTRGGTKKYLDTIKKLQDKNQKVGAICVVTKQSTDKIIDNYKYFKERGQSLNLRPMIESGEALNNKDIFSVDIEKYIKNLKELLNIWFYDKECNINLQPFGVYLDMLVYKRASVCCYTSCIGNWFCLEANGDISPCNRYFPSEYVYGNVNNIKKFKEVYKSEGMYNLLSQAIERREKCKAECEYFNVCNGGCNNEAMVTGSISNKDMPSCKILTAIVPELKNLLDNVSDLEDINPKIKEKVKKYIENKKGENCNECK